tara:strand:- start:165 stop:356 length:192 start_codon:yes stop_codon:yes gene_type:complete
MDLFELKYTEEIYELYSRIQALLDHYLVEHQPIDMTDIYDIIHNHTELLEDTIDDSEEDIDSL